MRALILMTLLLACGYNTQKPKVVASKEAWNRQNDPSLFHDLKTNFLYETKFASLPVKAKLSETPWSGDYWPTYRGGITQRWNAVKKVGNSIPTKEELKSFDLSKLSPAEKFDLFNGDLNFGLTKYEFNRTQILKTIPESDVYDKEFQIPTWEGLCHSWAPATLAYKNPGPVTLTGKLGHEIPFGSSDIKALLTYYLHLNNGGQTYFVGQRCNDNFEKLRVKVSNGEMTEKEYQDTINSSACRDVNAGTFHLVLTNQIGLMDQGFIVDITRDFEVWNQPVFGFETKVLSRSDKVSEGASPEAVEEVTVETRMDYINEVSQSFERTDPTWKNASNVYQYRLELNKNGEIVGAEWITKNRVDFLWKREVPKFSGPFRVLNDIYYKSLN